MAETVPPARGRFVVLEGGEGSGKSTQIGRLIEFLRAEGVNVVRTREPGGTDGAERIRGLLVTGDTSRWDGLTEVLLLAAARRDHLRRVILPELDAGTWVVSDRFVGSTRAYQGYGHGVPLTAIDDIHRIACDGIEPDLTLVLDLPVEIGLARARDRNGDAPIESREGRFEALDVAFHQRLRDGFLDMATRSPERFAIVDATGSVDAVATLIADAVTRLREADR